MDEMTFAEMSDYLEGMEKNNQDEWEKIRMLMYTIVQVNNTDRIEPSDVISFPWEKTAEKQDDSGDIEELRKRAENFKK